ncbi:hypothetical protein ACEPPN_000371 [Leptodophora sp. 'Broadleaf-Isolate-01']
MAYLHCRIFDRRTYKAIIGVNTVLRSPNYREAGNVFCAKTNAAGRISEWPGRDDAECTLDRMIQSIRSTDPEVTMWQLGVHVGSHFGGDASYKWVEVNFMMKRDQAYLLTLMLRPRSYEVAIDPWNAEGGPQALEQLELLTIMPIRPQPIRPVRLLMAASKPIEKSNSTPMLVDLTTPVNRSPPPELKVNTTQREQKSMAPLIHSTSTLGCDQAQGKETGSSGADPTHHLLKMLPDPLIELKSPGGTTDGSGISIVETCNVQEPAHAAPIPIQEPVKTELQPDDPMNVVTIPPATESEKKSRSLEAHVGDTGEEKTRKRRRGGNGWTKRKDRN